MAWKRATVGFLAGLLFLVPTASGAVHFYRGPGGGCTPAEGELTEPPGTAPNVTATVVLLHNTFNDLSSGAPVTRIKAGESVRWLWWSSHCHSVQQDVPGFTSGFHYPTTPPDSPSVLPGLFDYPVPDQTPTLSYVRTFASPGTYLYYCIHHSPIGMRGAVVVDAY